MSPIQLGIIGLGRIGGNLALQAMEKKIKVVGLDLEPKPQLEAQGLKIAPDIASLARTLTHPRVIYLSLPAGPAVDSVLQNLLTHLEQGDVVLDGGNSFFLDSVRRENDLRARGIHFLDCGTSGGVEGARRGACFMVGGREEGVRLAEPILKKLAVEGGYLHTGPPGSGHFVKLVHNGIEFGMLQAIGDGVELLAGSEFRLDLEKIFHVWSHGSVIRGWLVELMAGGLKTKALDDIESYVEDTGEVNWLVQYAINREIPIPVISQSIMELFRFRQRDGVAAKSVALMRKGFGGHSFGPDAAIARERKTSRIQKI